MTIRTACRDTAVLVSDRFDLTTYADEPLLARAGGEQLGRVQFSGGSGPVATLVLVTLAVGTMASEMLCVFTPPGSGVPHLALDVIAAPESTALHLDLLPRVDVSTHPAYLEHCLEPLTPAATNLLDHPGVQQTQLPRRQLALMSRWALTCQVPPTALDVAHATVDSYVDHWCDLAGGLPADVQAELAGEDLAVRDRRVRSALFSPTLDPVWAMLADLIGPESSELVRKALAAEQSA